MDHNMDPHIIDILVPQQNNDVYLGTLPANCPKPTNFENFLHWASKEYCIVFDVIVTRAVQEVYEASSQRALIKKEKNVKPKLAKVPSTVAKDSDSNEDHESSTFNRPDLYASENKVHIETVYDCNENLVKLNFVKNKIVPRLVMNVIALSVPYQKYLTSITINTGLNMDTLYEISKLLPNSQIIEICLDGTFLSKANYHVLLTHGKLKHLSLARCTINDDVVKMITDQLKEPCPAAKVLSALNLSTNRITDTGAKFIADMLRSNRQLCYLNLAGNMITDEGGVSILETLQKFPVHSHELQESRLRYVTYLKQKNTLIKTLLKELQTTNAPKKKSLKKGKVDSQSLNYAEIDDQSLSLHERAEYLAEKKLGLFVDSFSPNNTKSQDNVVYCFGNNVLCCLNLAYNNLTYISVKKLLEVLTTQKHLNRTPRGLIKVVIEGNLMPVACEEYKEIDQMLGTSVKTVKSTKHTDTATKKKPLSSKSITFIK